MTLKPCSNERSATELRKFLRYYHRHHEHHPFPEGWTEDLTQLIWAAQGDPKAIPEVVLTKPTSPAAPALKIEIDLSSPVTTVVAFYDSSGQGLSVPEMFHLASTILGTEITLADLDDMERELFLEGVTSPTHLNDGTWTTFFRFVWDIPEPSRRS